MNIRKLIGYTFAIMFIAIILWGGFIAFNTNEVFKKTFQYFGILNLIYIVYETFKQNKL